MYKMDAYKVMHPSHVLCGLLLSPLKDPGQVGAVEINITHVLSIYASERSFIHI